MMYSNVLLAAIVQTWHHTGFYMEPILVQWGSLGVLIKEPYKKVLYRTFRGSIYEASDITLFGSMRNLFSRSAVSFSQYLFILFSESPILSTLLVDGLCHSYHLGGEREGKGKREEK